MGEQETWDERSKTEREDPALLDSCAKHDDDATGSSSSSSQRRAESLRREIDNDEYPICSNCQLRHPGDSKGSFCTEGKQGPLETLFAMATLGLVGHLGNYRSIM